MIILILSQRDAFQQKMFEFNFTVHTLTAAIFKAHPDHAERDRLLVNTVLQNFTFNFALRKFDMAVDIRLRSLSVEDKMVADGSKFQQLVTSEEMEKGDVGTPTDLVRVQYTRVQTNSPEFMTVHEGFNQVRRTILLLTFDAGPLMTCSRWRSRCRPLM